MDINEIMGMPLNKWPMGLREFTQLVMARVGFSGDVLYTCAEQWIEAGRPVSRTAITKLYVDLYIAARIRALEAERDEWKTRALEAEALVGHTEQYVIDALENHPDASEPGSDVYTVLAVLQIAPEQTSVK